MSMRAMIEVKMTLVGHVSADFHWFHVRYRESVDGVGNDSDVREQMADSSK